MRIPGTYLVGMKFCDRNNHKYRLKCNLYIINESYSAFCFKFGKPYFGIDKVQSFLCCKYDCAISSCVSRSNLNSRAVT